MKTTKIALLAALSTAFALAGCGKKETPPPAAGASTSGTAEASATAGDTAKSAYPGLEADLAATLKHESNFYVIKTAADIPTNLAWTSGPDLPEFADPNAKKGGTLNFYLQDFPRTMRTIGPDSSGGMRQYLLDYIVMGLVLEHPNYPGQAVPGLAKEWAPVREERTMYFRLDERARWSDGAPVTTDDVIFSFYFHRSGFHKLNWYTDFYSKTWEKVTVFDKYTFALTLAELRPDFDTRVAGMTFYPKHAMADLGPDFVEKYQWRVLPTTGAYTVREEDIDKGQSVTLTRVKDWWARDLKYYRGRYNPDRYRFRIIRDHDKALEAFMRGDIDIFQQMTAVPKYWYDTLPNNHPLVADGYVHKATFYNRIPRPDWGLYINTAKHLLDNKDVRWGIQYASNFDMVASQFYRGDAMQMNTRNDGYSWRVHPTMMARKFDPVKAREYFAKAGFTKQGPDGVLTNDQGERLSFTITTYRPDIRDIMTILKTEAIKAGLEFNIEVLDQSTGWKKFQQKQHEIGLLAFSRSPELFPRYWEDGHGSNAYEDAYIGPDGKFVEKFSDGTPNPKPTRVRPNTNNYTSTFIPEFDRLIEHYDRSASLDEMKALAVKMEEILYEEAAWVPGWAQPYFRCAYWRWVRWPEGMNPMLARYADEFFVHWIDEDMEKETRSAKNKGQTFPPGIHVFDQYKEP
ncbi:MAG: ABC transporter substrate-binding protein [Opitutaceae bacterium]|nr:ABC transporter substrate-binding protein [Opitutaceae bacterium]